MYDVVTRVPLVVWSPQRFSGGRRIESLCQLMDVGATILELAQVENPEPMDALSLVPALTGARKRVRELVIAEQRGDNVLRGVGLMTMVRTERWKLVDFTNEPDGQLFDLRNDPFELRNRWHEAGLSGLKSRLRHALAEHLEQSLRLAPEFKKEWGG